MHDMKIDEIITWKKIRRCMKSKGESEGEHVFSFKQFIKID